jgi:hypothetical protein
MTSKRRSSVNKVRKLLLADRFFVCTQSTNWQPYQARLVLMTDTIEDSGRVGRRWNPIVATVTLLLLAPLALILPAVIVVAGLIAHSAIVPAHSASTTIPDLETDLTLRFYYTWDENTDAGRYLYVNTPRGRTRIAMTAFDWAHNSRTSIYLTPEREIAVLGPSGDDYLVSLDPLTTKVAAGVSENWAYLGAFDFQLTEDGGRPLRFVSAAEQAECIPMLSEGPYQADKVRTIARQRNCSHFYVQPAAK